MGQVWLTDQPINPTDVLSHTHEADLGAIATFLGSVRDREDNEVICAIHYEAYEPMAQKELEQIVQMAERRYGVRIAVCHRLGRVPVGEISVVVAVGARHRREAFEACQWVVDALKHQVPIWKVRYEAAVAP